MQPHCPTSPLNNVGLTCRLLLVSRRYPMEYHSLRLILSFYDGRFGQSPTVFVPSKYFRTGSFDPPFGDVLICVLEGTTFFALSPHTLLPMLETSTLGGAPLPCQLLAPIARCVPVSHFRRILSGIKPESRCRHLRGSALHLILIHHLTFRLRFGRYCVWLSVYQRRHLVAFSTYAPPISDSLSCLGDGNVICSLLAHSRGFAYHG